MRWPGMDMRSSIEDTRKGFEESFASGEFYNRQTQDSDHMEKILRFVKIRGKMRILDLGCGNGYRTVHYRACEQSFVQEKRADGGHV